jgi:hypothetical protein
VLVMLVLVLVLLLSVMVQLLLLEPVTAVAGCNKVISHLSAILWRASSNTKPVMFAAAVG